MIQSVQIHFMTTSVTLTDLYIKYDKKIILAGLFESIGFLV